MTNPPMKNGPTQRTKDKAASREAVLAAALELFERDGLSVSLRAICRRAKHSTGTFFEHWRGKDEIIEELTKTEPAIRALRIRDAITEISIVAQHHPSGREIMAGAHQAATASIE